MMMGDMVGSAYLWAALILVLLAAATTGVIALVVMLGRGNRAESPRAPLPGDEARDILRRRYAAGEIDEDEYLQRLSGIAQR